MMCKIGHEKVGHPIVSTGLLTTVPDATEDADLIDQMRRSMRDTNKNIIELMKWTPGTGKTYAAEKVAIEMAADGLTTVFAMLSNERAEQEAEAMQDRFGYQAAVIKGRNEDNCADFESAQALGQAGHGVRNVLCRKCPHRQNCFESGYLSQFDDFQSGRTKIAFMPIESAVNLLKDNKGNATLKADVLVFDENPDRVAMQTHSLTIKQLNSLSTSTNSIRVVIDLLIALIESVQRNDEVLNDWQPLKKCIRRILSRFERKGGAHAELSINSESVLDDAIDHISTASNELHWLARLGFRLSPEYVVQTQRPRWFADIVAELKRILISEDSINVSLVVTDERLVFRQSRRINPRSKMVVLDAYGRLELYQQALYKEVRLREYEVKPDWTVYYASINTSKTRLKDGRSGRWTDDKWTEMLQWLTGLFEFERMVVFVDGKETVAKAEAAVRSIEMSQQVTVDYFYRGRGTNEYQDFDAVLILGQAEPRSDVIGSECRALHRDDEYISDDVMSSNRRQFRDSRLQQYKESKQLDEIMQSAYRIRPATTSHLLGKKLIVCTGFEIEGLTDQSDVIRLGGDEQCYTTSVQAEVRRTQLCNCVKKHCSESGYVLTASALNARLNKILPQSQSGREFLTFAYYNIEDNLLISKCEKPSDNKTFRVSEKTIKKDLKILVKRGVIEAHQQTVVLDGKRYSPVVYGSLNAFNADIERAKAVLSEN